MNIRFIKSLVMVTAVAFTGCCLPSCDKEEIIINSYPTGFESVQESKELPFSYEADAKNIEFTAKGAWHIELEDGVDWVYFTPSVGKKGANTVKVSVSQNVGAIGRAAIFNLISGEEKVMFTVRQPEFGGVLKEIEEPESPFIDPETIPDYDKFFANSEHGENILNKSANFSFARYKQSEHFFVFWAAGFGDNPNAPTVPAALRVDIDDLLAKAEHFFDTNVNKLGMATVGEGKSYLDKYKMQIYLLYQDEWLATGSGYDNVIGALWVNPSTCQPVGSTIAHEIGHSFQYQVYCDKVLQGAPDDMRHGFRYGFSEDGNSGCSYWEQCAQWQAQVDYPEEMFGYHVPVWTANCHRIFYHEYMRYASYWLQHDWVARHGVEAYGRIWRESAFPEDPIETYTRLYNNSDMEKTYDEMYDYAAHMVYYDIPGVKEYAVPEVKGNYKTNLYRVDNNKYQVAYSSTPGTAGFNVIRMMTSAGKKVSVKVEALETGCGLAPKDPGSVVNADGGIVGATKNYNSQSNKTSCFRYGFVAVVDGNPVYSAMTKGASGTASYDVPANASELYFVILGSPEKYNRVAWNDMEGDDEQWPYTITVSETDVYDYTEPSLPEYKKIDANNMEVSYNVAVDPDNEDWSVGALNLMSAEMCEFFGVDFAGLSDLMLAPAVGEQVVKTEGKIVVFNRNADGTLSDMPTANVGYWVKADGTAADYGDAVIYYETSGINLTLGKKGAVGTAGETMTMRPVYVYTADGIEKTVSITINYQVKGKAAAMPRRIPRSKMKKF